MWALIMIFLGLKMLGSDEAATTVLGAVIVVSALAFAMRFLCASIPFAPQSVYAAGGLAVY